MRIALAAFSAVSVASIAVAQNPLSVSKPEADNSVEAELKSFALADGYEANLFADEKFMKFAARLRPLLVRQEIQLLQSAPWGPRP